MQIVGFDHYNLRAPRAVLDDLRAFYCDIVGLVEGDRPPFRSFGYWLYAGGRPVLHLSESKPGESCPSHVASTFSHASFTCVGRRAFERRLAERGIEYRVAQVPLIGQVQLFFSDPAGNGVELGFARDDE